MDKVKRLEKDSIVSKEHMTKPEADHDMADQCEGLFAACNRLDAEAVKDALDGIAIIHTTPGELSGAGNILEECGGLHRNGPGRGQNVKHRK